MLSASSSSAAISLLTDSSENGDSQTAAAIPSHRVTEVRKLVVHVSDISVMTMTEAVDQFTRKSCAHRSLEYILNLDLDSYIHRYLNADERRHLQSIVQLTASFPVALRILGTLLSRQWPKWQLIPVSLDEEMVLDALRDIGAILTPAFVRDWAGESITYPLFPTDHPLLSNLAVFKSVNMLDLLLNSLPGHTIKELAQCSTASRAGLTAKLKNAYNGTQRTIFGGCNDTGNLVKKVTDHVEKGSRLVMLSESCRRLFLTLSFALDIDADDEFAWNSALPQTLLKGFANKGIGGSLTPRTINARSSMGVNVPDHLRVFVSRDHINTGRILSFLQARVEARKLCAQIVSANVRDYLGSLDCAWSPAQSPEWWWRRQLPRRCSNLLWKCIGELFKDKCFDISASHLKFLVTNNASLLGKKRRGKVALRLLIDLGHIGGDIAGTATDLLNMNLYDADRAEIQRRMAKVSANKHEWPCGNVCERVVVIAGANSRDFNWVEQAAIDHHYVGGGRGYTHGVHCEGRVMMTIFNAIFKDVLMPVTLLIDRPGIIQSPLQRWAMDVGYLLLDPARWAMAESVLAELAQLDHDGLVAHYLSKQPQETDFDIPSILSCMEGSVLSAIMRLIVADPYYWGGGQPDLLLWNTETREILFSEVKGPGDQLSPRQRWWLAELTKAGAQAEVCFVVDVKTSKRKVSEELISPVPPRPKQGRGTRENKRKAPQEQAVTDVAPAPIKADIIDLDSS